MLKENKMSEILELLSYIKLIVYRHIVYTYYSERFRTFKNNNYIFETWLSNYVL